MIRTFAALSFLAVAFAPAAATAGEPAAADAPGTLLTLPEAPAWQHSRAFVEAFNAGDGESLARYFAQRLSTRAATQQAGLQRAAALQRLRHEIGPIEVIEASGVPHVLVLNASSRGGAGVDIVVLVSADDPRQIDDLLVVRAGADVALGVAP